ncbi:otoancorin-like, partial [Mustelus asterias]
MVTLLDEEMLLQLPNTTVVKDALLEYSAVQVGTAASPEFDATGNSIESKVKIFIIVVGDRAQTGSTAARTAACKVVPSAEEIQELGEANSYWTVEQLGCMSTQTFEDTVDFLSSVLGFSQQQRVALMDKAVEAWGPTSGFDQEQVTNLKYLISVLDVADLRQLDLSSIDTLDGMASCPTWTQEK